MSTGKSANLSGIKCIVEMGAGVSSSTDCTDSWLLTQRTSVEEYSPTGSVSLLPVSVFATISRWTHLQPGPIKERADCSRYCIVIMSNQ